MIGLMISILIGLRVPDPIVNLIKEMINNPQPDLETTQLIDQGINRHKIDLDPTQSDF